MNRRAMDKLFLAVFDVGELGVSALLGGLGVATGSAGGAWGRQWFVGGGGGATCAGEELRRLR